MKKLSLKLVLLLLVCIVSINVYSQEICGNGLDDDNDGMLDWTDDECFCDSLINPLSLIPNASFEETLCCPSGFSQVYCASGWIQATDATSDYYNCNYAIQSIINAGLTASDGTGFMGAIFMKNWKEYLGSCLISPLPAGVACKLEMDVAMLSMFDAGGTCPQTFSDVRISLFGSPTCTSLPQGTYGCPTTNDLDGGQLSSSDWVLLGDFLYSPSQSWGTFTIDFIPSTSIGAIMLGPPCNLPADYPDHDTDFICLPYVLFDNLILNETSNFFESLPAPTIYIEEWKDCQGQDYKLSTDDVSGATMYWITPNQDTLLGNELFLNNFDLPEEGIYSTYLTAGNCTSDVAQTNILVDPNAINLNQLNLPNIISPNLDGINDYLDAEEIAKGCGEFEMTIWNRWGNVVFKQINGQPAFIGKNLLDNKVVAGVYFYCLRLEDKYYRQSLTVAY